MKKKKITIEIDDDIIGSIRCLLSGDYTTLGELNLVAVIGERIVSKIRREHPEVLNVKTKDKAKKS